MAKPKMLTVCQITSYMGQEEAFRWAARVTTFEAKIHRKGWKMGDRKQYGYAVVRVLKPGENLPGHVFDAPEADLIDVKNMLKTNSGIGLTD